MHTQRIREVLAEAIVGRHLLTHPFYRRWEDGTLDEGELAAYAEQYRHIERELPVTLSAIASRVTGSSDSMWRYCSAYAASSPGWRVPASQRR